MTFISLFLRVKRGKKKKRDFGSNFLKYMCGMVDYFKNHDDNDGGNGGGGGMVEVVKVVVVVISGALEMWQGDDIDDGVVKVVMVMTVVRVLIMW